MTLLEDTLYFALGPHPQRLCLAAYADRSALPLATVRLVNADPHELCLRGFRRSAWLLATFRLVRVG